MSNASTTLVDDRIHELEPFDHRPSIDIKGRQLELIVADAVRALVAANDPPRLFMRSGEVVRVRRDENGRPRVEVIGETAFLEELSRVALWVRRGRDGDELDAHLTRSQAGVILAGFLRDESSLPPLRGLTESPILAADGTIHEEEGYDGRSGLFYAPEPGFELSPVPDGATEEQFFGAVRCLSEVLADFPFRGPADRAAAWAALLTPPLRSIIPGPVPAILIDAPSPGTGKTLLAKAIGVLATGRVPMMMSPAGGRDDAEWRKRITSALLDGGTLAVVDNVEDPMGSAALASVITSEEWTDRRLGHSEMVRLPSRLIWVVTGNNLRLRGDLPRRAVWCRLDAQVVRPWTREEFRHRDLLAWIRGHRGALLAAVFTLARTWLASERSGPCSETPRIGGFEGWRHTIGGILRLAGIEGFLGNLPELYDTADEETPAWTAFLEAWRRWTTAPVTASELAGQFDASDTFLEALPADLLEARATRHDSFTRRLGKALSKRVDTRYPAAASGQCLRIEKAGEASGAGGALQWRVVAE